LLSLFRKNRKAPVKQRRWLASDGGPRNAGEKRVPEEKIDTVPPEFTEGFPSTREAEVIRLVTVRSPRVPSGAAGKCSLSRLARKGLLGLTKKRYVILPRRSSTISSSVMSTCEKKRFRHAQKMGRSY